MKEGWTAGVTRKDTTRERSVKGKQESADGNTVHHRSILGPILPIPTANCSASKECVEHTKA